MGMTAKLQNYKITGRMRGNRSRRWASLLLQALEVRIRFYKNLIVIL